MQRFPDPAHPDATIALSQEWSTAGGDDQQALADTIIEARRRDPWPDGLLSYSLFLDADGGRIRDYAQWTAEPPPGDQIAYRLYRGSRPPDGRLPGAMVAVRVDTESAEVARRWVDAVFEALENDQHLPAGGIGAFFHISTDGQHVLNYAEWETAEHHRRAVAASGGSISRGPLWDKVQTMPGVKQVSVTRYHVYPSESLSRTPTSRPKSNTG